MPLVRSPADPSPVASLNSHLLFQVGIRRHEIQDDRVRRLLRWRTPWIHPEVVLLVLVANSRILIISWGSQTVGKLYPTRLSTSQDLHWSYGRELLPLGHALRVSQGGARMGTASAGLHAARQRGSAWPAFAQFTQSLRKRRGTFWASSCCNSIANGVAELCAFRLSGRVVLALSKSRFMGMAGAGCVTLRLTSSDEEVR